MAVVVHAAGPVSPPDLSQWLGPNQNDTLGAPISNPYPLPGTQYSIAFYAVPPSAPTLNREHCINCINNAHRLINQHIQTHGDGPIPENVFKGLTYSYRTVEFIIAPAPGAGPDAELSYSDAATVLDAYALKMSREGYYTRPAFIFVTDGGRRAGKALFMQAERDGSSASGNNITATSPASRITNPYQVEGTPFSLNFREGRGVNRPLVGTDVLACISSIRRAVFERIQLRGNGPVPSVLAYHFGDVGFTVERASQHVQYGDVGPIALAFGRKMGWDGYHARYADIILSDGGEGVGSAFMT
ncbi:MAG: hypothetical protein Q9207_003117 [Kuettlingeria erythrocarpa]